jgi:hypothetical protein
MQYRSQILNVLVSLYANFGLLDHHQGDKIGQFFNQLGNFLKLIVIYKKMVTFWATFCLSQFFTSSSK